MINNVIIFSDNPSALPELYGCAKALSENVGAFYIGEKAEAKGAENVYYLGDLSGGRLYESYVPAMKAVIEEVKPELILFPATVRCRLIAARLAAWLGTSVLTDSKGIDFDGGIVSKRMVFGGTAFKTERAVSTAVVCLSGGVAQAAELPEGNVVDRSASAIDEGITLKSVEEKKSEGVDLTAAKKIVCVGRAFTNDEELAVAREFAAAIGAEVGCTRPVAEDGLMPHKSYVGISGAMLSPDVYFGFGISGQIQHLVGANSAKVMFAINKDANAPIFKCVDYGMVGKVEEIIPELTKRLKK